MGTYLGVPGVVQRWKGEPEEPEAGRLPACPTPTPSSRHPAGRLSTARPSPGWAQSGNCGQDRVLPACERHTHAARIPRAPSLSRRPPWCVTERSPPDSGARPLWSAISVFQQSHSESVLVLWALLRPGFFPVPTTHPLFPSFGFLNGRSKAPPTPRSSWRVKN